MSEYILKVGKKGELYTPKKFRLKIGLLPGNEIIAVTKGEQILLKKRKTILNLLEEDTIASVTTDEIIKERRVLEKEISDR